MHDPHSAPLHLRKICDTHKMLAPVDAQNHGVCGRDNQRAVCTKGTGLQHDRRIFWMGH